MGARKHNSAEAMKAARKELYFAKANGIPSRSRHGSRHGSESCPRCAAFLYS